MQAHCRGGSIVDIASILGRRQDASVPGCFDTDINGWLWETDAGKAMVRRVPQRRLGTLSDLDGPLLLLASDASAHMTGAVLAVDGGHLVSTL